MLYYILYLCRIGMSLGTFNAYISELSPANRIDICKYVSVHTEYDNRVYISKCLPIDIYRKVYNGQFHP